MATNEDINIKVHSEGGEQAIGITPEQTERGIGINNEAIVVRAVSSYNDLDDKPQINSVELEGDKSASDLGFADVAMSGSYNDLTDTPEIPAAQVNADWNADSGVAEILNKPTIPTKTSQLDNDSGFLTSESDPVFSASAAATITSQDITDWDNKSDFSGSYNDLTDKPTIPTKTSQLTNDGSDGTSTYVEADELATVATSGNYNDLSNRPTIPAAQVNADWDANSGVAQILNKPSLATVATSGSYNDLSNKPTIPAAQANSDWDAVSGVAQILNKPSLATVATSGLYSDLSGTPTIPTKTSDLTNDGADNTSTYVEADELATVATSGSYNDLSNKPTIPAAQVNSDWDAASGVAQILNKPSLATVATSGSYNDLTDKPSITPELVEMSYGESNAWAKFIAAYNAHCVVYCRASSAANPASGSQTRKAFMAYVNNATNPTQVEFQYYRSVSSHTDAQQGDQVFIYLLTNASGGTWSVTTRNTFSKVVAGTNMTSTYSNGQITLNATQPTVPTNTSDLTNDSGFITNTVNNLVNYYTKTETDSAIGAETTNRENADQGLQEQIDALASASDVVDVVGTYADLQNYDTSHLNNNDIIKVLTDETHNDAISYYRWNTATSTFSYIGSQGPFYTKSESDAAFVPQTRTVNNKALSSDITLTASDVGALPNSTVIPTVNNATLTIQKEGSSIGTFTANASTNSTVNIVETDPTVPAWAKASSKPSYSWDEIVDKPTIPTVNDATLTIQRNGTNVQTFTANASSNVTADISVPTKTSDLVNDGSDNTAQYLETDETAYKTASIPYGECASTSTATAFTATVPGITELRDGVCMWLKNGVVTSASGFTININNLGAKPVYSNMAAASRETTLWNVAYTMLFVYDSDRVEGGCWILYRGYDSNTNTLAYQVRTNSSTLPAKQTGYRYRLWLTSADGQYYVPINTATGTSTTSTKALNTTTPIDPFGTIVYNSTNGTVNADASLPTGTQWTQYTLDLRYAKYPLTTLTYPDPVYLQCTPQSTGGALINDIVQTLPTTEDGKIYIYLGTAYSTVSMELKQNHPVYYFKDGAIRLWTNQTTGVTSFNGSTGAITYTAPVTSVNGSTGAITGLQTTGNLVTSVSGSSTDSQYPSAKLFYDTIGNVETILNTLNNGGGAQ